jgi:translation initiation factor 2 subunit 2
MSKEGDKDVDEVTELFKGLAKKKKSKKPKDAEAGEEEAAPAADGEFDPSALKKKKKSRTKKADTGDFEAKLAEAGVAEEGATEKAGEDELPSGDHEAGTGIWAHDAEQPIPYQLLVTRFFSLIQSHHPDLLSSGSKSYRIPPPQCLREGNRRTIFANIAEICKRMKRTEDHVMQFLFAELGTSGSVDGSRRLVIKGRFQQKQIENVLRRYIGTCNRIPYLVLSFHLLQMNHREKKNL